jgi:hypothetical protein
LQRFNDRRQRPARQELFNGILGTLQPFLGVTDGEKWS